MAREYRLLRGATVDGRWAFSPEMTAHAVESAYPNATRSAERLSREAHDVARRVALGEFSPKKPKKVLPDDWDPFADTDPREHEYLFILARRLMAALQKSSRRSADVARGLAPYAIVYVEALQHLGAYPETAERLNWDDDEEVMETFTAVYRKVRYASDETLPSTTMDKADARPLRIKGKGEKMLRLLSFAYYLQTSRGENAIALPVEQMGSLLGCAPTFVSQLIANAVSEGYLEPVNQKYSRARGRAKTYRFATGRLAKNEFPK